MIEVEICKDMEGEHVSARLTWKTKLPAVEVGWQVRVSDDFEADVVESILVFPNDPIVYVELQAADIRHPARGEAAEIGFIQDEAGETGTIEWIDGGPSDADENGREL